MFEIKQSKREKIIKYASLGAILLGFVFIFIALSRGGQEAALTSRSLPKVTLIDVSQYRQGDAKINTTGQVQSLGEVEIKSQTSAKVTKINFSIGDEVKTGQVIITLDNADIIGQLLQAQAGLDGQLAALREMEKGARDEKVQIARTAVATAKSSLLDAEKNLENVKNKAKVDLQNTYASSYTALQTAANSAKKALLTLTDIQKSHFVSLDQESLAVKNAKEKAILVFFDEPFARDYSTYTVSLLNGGLYGKIKAVSSVASSEIEELLSETLLALKTIKNALDTVPTLYTFSATESANLAAERASIAGQITAISASVSGLASQKAINQSLISGAEAGVTNAKNGLKKAQDQLVLTLAGATDEELAAQRARVKSARGVVAQAAALYNKTIIRSPIDGKIAILPVKIGELVSPGQIVAMVVNDSGLKIKTYIDSSDLKKITIGDKALIENNEAGLVARISPSIDPATKKIQVDVAVTDIARSNLVIGQFVNVEIFFNRQPTDSSLYLVPLQAIKNKPEGAFVFTINQSRVVSRPVSLGRVIGESVEIIAGLDPGMKILSSVRGIRDGQKVEVLN